MSELGEFMRAEALPASFEAAVEQIHKPLRDIILERRGALGRACLVGLCGPQGSGKSTGAAILKHLLEAHGLRVAIISLDDFYLPRAARLALARQVHPLLATRGPPGTHDIALAEQVIGQLLDGDDLALPAFDKATDDRSPPSAWPLFQGPAEVVIFEGWCVGARPQPPGDLGAPVNALERDEDGGGVWRRFVNEALGRYQALFGRIDLLIQLRAPSFEHIYRWRCEQEEKLRRRAGGAGAGKTMSDSEIGRFIQHYERLSRHIDGEMPGRAGAIVQLGPQRELLGLEVHPRG